MKLYADEAGSSDVREMEQFVVSTMALVEVPAAIWGKVRSGELDEMDAEILVHQFQSDWSSSDSPEFLAIALTPEVLASAADLARARSLRAYDAVQLATALAARSVAPEIDTFACYDNNLREAGEAEGFQPFPDSPPD